ncbi:hypothetical protein L484_010346 [Morus notabilis]|uniref:Negatively light-regulated protein n=2 Tax=Morus notabilis TaxID=981085 RepID=W9RND1_9ROSA|nr:hypothetical protein L484_010346 [Morus notabilis]
MGEITVKSPSFEAYASIRLEAYPSPRLYKTPWFPMPSFKTRVLRFAWVVQDIMSGVEDTSEQTMPLQKEEEAAVRKKYGGIMPKKPPLISKDHERAFFDSADWALGKQGVEKPKGPLEALRPKLQPTQQQTRYRKSPCAPADGEDGTAASEDTTGNE